MSIHDGLRWACAGTFPLGKRLLIAPAGIINVPICRICIEYFINNNYFIFYYADCKVIDELMFTWSDSEFFDDSLLVH